MSGENSGRKKKIIKIVGIVAAVVILIIILITSAIKKLSDKASEYMDEGIMVEEVEVRDLSDSINLSGTVSGDTKTNVTSVAGGKILGVNVQLGDVVTKGTTIVTIDTTDIQEQIEDLKNAIKSTNAISDNEKKQKKQSLDEAKEDQKKTLEAAKKVIDKAEKATSKAKDTYQNLSNNYNTKSEKLTSAEKKYNTCKSEMEQAASGVEKANKALNDEDYQTQLAYDNAVALYTTKKDAFDLALEEYTSLKSEVEMLKEQIEAAKESYEMAKESQQDATASYNETLISTNRSVQAIQNSIEMEQYETSSTKDMQKQLTELQKQLENCIVKAPCDGLVTAVNISTGDTYAPGTPMVTIEGTNTLKVIVDVQESDILKLEEGMKAIVTAPALEDEEIQGTVTRVVKIKSQGGMGDYYQSATGYSAEITIENTKLLVNMSAKAKIVLYSRPAALAVPYDLVQYDEENKAYIMTATKNDNGKYTAHKTKIKVGQELDYYVEVTGGDLKEGDKLAIDYSFSLNDGDEFTESNYEY
ncbi:MAG: efflux RND transporter periplasmic adaptor subunit [Lachnospiraceae bacterium]|nr:efflux RND transporter periplasmic adaptor subunit [Lachnospiraceae bacterium]